MSVPTFFVPTAMPTDGTNEEKFARLANFARQRVPLLNERIYSITFDADGVLAEWTATVGKTLRRGKRLATRSKRKYEPIPRPERMQPLSDPATVLAIFQGDPYIVVTNSRIDPEIRSTFENPFFAGQPKSVVRFRLPDATG